MITSPYVLGDFMSHQTNISDKLLYNNLHEFKYFNLFSLYFCIFQIFTFSGYNLFSYLPVLCLIGLSIFLYLKLKDEIIDSDIDYSLTNDALGISYTIAIGCVIMTSIDIIFVYFMSRSQIYFLWNLNNKFENRFALFSCFIVFSRLLISFIYITWIRTLTEKAKNFEMILKTKS